MDTVQARLNHGRWIWDCPDCKAGNRVKPKDELVFCGSEKCYPGKVKKKLDVINGAVVEGIDFEAQKRAKRKAWAEGKVYEIEFPDNHAEIVKVLRKRKEEHQCWEPGETIEDLLLEERTNARLYYLNLPEEIRKQLQAPVMESLPDLDDAILRRIK